MTGIPISTWQQEVPEKFPYDFVNIGIIPSDRAVLHDNIAKRFKQMLELGFIEEVEGLRARGDLNLSMPSMRAVGYRQVWEYLDDLSTREEMLEKGIAATRQLAKRQMTWLRSWKNLHTYNSLDNMFGIFKN
jgi:tRNA dimethylallyltransferase